MQEVYISNRKGNQKLHKVAGSQAITLQKFKQLITSEGSIYDWHDIRCVEVPLVSLKRRLSSWRDILKLIALTNGIPMLLIPLAYYGQILTAGDSAEAVFQMLGFELLFLIFMVLPPAFLLLGIGYAITHKAREKKVENAGYGYIIGFLIGVVGIGAFFGIFMNVTLELAGILGVAAAGFGIGVGLSYVSIRPQNSNNP